MDRVKAWLYQVDWYLVGVLVFLAFIIYQVYQKAPK